MQTETSSQVTEVKSTDDGYRVGRSATEKVGLFGVTPVVQPVALTTQLTTLVPADAAGTPDYAIQAITNSSPFGFETAAEAITTLYVIANLQARMAEVEARLVALGAISA